MRILLHDDPFHAMALYDRPYAGGLGVSLYAAATDPNADPGTRAIEYRRCRILDGADSVLPGIAGVFALGAESVPKSPRLATVAQPTAEITYTIPAEWNGQSVWVQLRTYAADFENETIYRPRQLVLNGDGEDETPVLGTATVLALEKRDNGGLRVQFAYDQPRDGLVPTQFVLDKLTGTGDIMPGVVAYTVGERLYEIDVSGLTHATEYTFSLSADSDMVTTLLLTGIAFTADAEGPPAVTATYEEW